MAVVEKGQAELTAQAIRDKVATIPDFKSLVAALGGAGIKGTRGDACKCPIAKWLELDPEIAAVGIEVGSPDDPTGKAAVEFIYWDDHGGAEGGHDRVFIELPQHFGQFIRRFDLCGLPQFDADRMPDAQGG